LSISRRLHRGGEGQYLVNKTTVRRLDLVELLADLGHGKGMHSIIGQGKVEAILASKPEERRALIEEAAGLGRFKARRHRAELKLARVGTQVERARDLEGEVAKRLRPLALQATAAERAEKLGGEIATLRAGIAASDLAEIERALAEAGRRREAAAAEREEADKRLEELLAERTHAEEALAAAGGALLEHVGGDERVTRLLAGIDLVEEIRDAIGPSVTTKGEFYDPGQGEISFAGETAEAVLLELEARHRSLLAEAETKAPAA